MKYVGPDGWLHDDSVPAREPSRAEPPVDAILYAALKAAAENKEPSRCPNCRVEPTWHREEGYCTACGWERPAGPEAPPPETAKVEESAVAEAKRSTILGCGLLLGAAVIGPLIGMGAGYSAGGFGGLLTGAGIGAVLPVALTTWSLWLAAQKPE